MLEKNFVILHAQKRKEMKTRKILLCLSFSLLPMLCGSFTTNSSSPNDESRKIFDYTYNMVFGPQGSSLSYNVNIIGVLKVDGSIWYKNKKRKFVEARYKSWNDGTHEYWVDTKKKTVTLYTPGKYKKDRYESKFSFNADDYNYSHKETKTTYELTLDARREVKGIKHLKAVIDRRTRVPKYLKIKVLWFWTTINITNFHSGGISDDVFRFPAEQYKSYQVIDERVG